MAIRLCIGVEDRARCQTAPGDRCGCFESGFPSALSMRGDTRVDQIAALKHYEHLIATVTGVGDPSAWPR